MSQVEYIARIHEAEDGSFWAEVIDLPGCFATGTTLDELREALEEAITMCRTETTGRTDAPRPQPMRVGEMRVTVPA